MGQSRTCDRCGGVVQIEDDAALSVTAGPEVLRRQGFVGFGDGAAVHTGCLSWAEADALFGGTSRSGDAPLTTDPRRRTGRFDRMPQQAPTPAVGVAAN